MQYWLDIGEADLALTKFHPIPPPDYWDHGYVLPHLAIQFFNTLSNEHLN